MSTTTLTRTCTDHRCTEGVTECAECNGYGVLTMGGRKYRRKSAGKNIGATAVKHRECNGTGLAVCGCQPVDTETLAIITPTEGSI